MADQPLNAAQHQAIEFEVRKRVQDVVAGMKMRQWAVEQAMMVQVSSKSVVEVAQEIFAFVSDTPNPVALQQ